MPGDLGVDDCRRLGRGAFARRACGVGLFNDTGGVVVDLLGCLVAVGGPRFPREGQSQEESAMGGIVEAVRAISVRSLIADVRCPSEKAQPYARPNRFFGREVPLGGGLG